MMKNLWSKQCANSDKVNEAQQFQWRPWRGFLQGSGRYFELASVEKFEEM